MKTIKNFFSMLIVLLAIIIVSTTLPSCERPLDVVPIEITNTEIRIDSVIHVYETIDFKLYTTPILPGDVCSAGGFYVYIEINGQTITQAVCNGTNGENAYQVVMKTTPYNSSGRTGTIIEFYRDINDDGIASDGDLLLSAVVILDGKDGVDGKSVTFTMEFSECDGGTYLSYTIYEDGVATTTNGFCITNGVDAHEIVMKVEDYTSGGRTGSKVMFFRDIDGVTGVSDGDLLLSALIVLDGEIGATGAKGVSTTMSVEFSECDGGTYLEYVMYEDGFEVKRDGFCIPNGMNGADAITLIPQFITSDYFSETSDSTGTLNEWYIAYENQTGENDTIWLESYVVWNGINGYNSIVNYFDVNHNETFEKIGDRRVNFLDITRNNILDDGDEILSDTIIYFRRSYIQQIENMTSYTLIYGYAIGYDYTEEGRIEVQKEVSFQKEVTDNSMTLTIYVNNDGIDGYQEGNDDVFIQSLYFENVQSCEITTESLFLNFDGRTSDYPGYEFSGVKPYRGRLFGNPTNGYFKTADFNSLFNNPEQLTNVSFIAGSSKAFKIKVKALLVAGGEVILLDTALTANSGFKYDNKNTYEEFNISVDDDLQVQQLVFEITYSLKCYNNEFYLDDLNITVGSKNCTSTIIFE